MDGQCVNPGCEVCPLPPVQSALPSAQHCTWVKEESRISTAVHPWAMLLSRTLCLSVHCSCPSGPSPHQLVSFLSLMHDLLVPALVRLPGMPSPSFPTSQNLILPPVLEFHAPGMSSDDPGHPDLSPPGTRSTPCLECAFWDSMAVESANCIPLPV